MQHTKEAKEPFCCCPCQICQNRNHSTWVDNNERELWSHGFIRKSLYNFVTSSSTTSFQQNLYWRHVSIKNTLLRLFTLCFIEMFFTVNDINGQSATFLGDALRTNTQLKTLNICGIVSFCLRWFKMHFKCTLIPSHRQLHWWCGRNEPFSSTFVKHNVERACHEEWETHPVLFPLHSKKSQCLVWNHKITNLVMVVQRHYVKHWRKTHH